MNYVLKNIVSTWRDRKVAVLTAKKDEDVIAVKVTDANYAKLRELKNTDEKCATLINLGSFVFSDAIKAQVAEIKKGFNSAVKAIDDIAVSALARLELAEDYADSVKLLKKFGILNRAGKINA